VRRMIARLDVDAVLASVLDTLVEDERAARAELWLRGGARRALQLRAAAGLARPGRPLALYDDVLREGRAIRFDQLGRRRALDARWLQRAQIAAVVVAPIPAPIPGDGEPAGVLAVFARADQVPQASLVEVLARLVASALQGATPSS